MQKGEYRYEEKIIKCISMLVHGVWFSSGHGVGGNNKRTHPLPLRGQHL